MRRMTFVLKGRVERAVMRRKLLREQGGGGKEGNVEVGSVDTGGQSDAPHADGAEKDKDARADQAFTSSPVGFHNCIVDGVSLFDAEGLETNEHEGEETGAEQDACA
eukprot:6186374-Pleurochrysis_carterae.AAC.3